MLWRISEQEHVFLIKNKENGKYVLSYQPNDAVRKAIFATKRNAEKALEQNVFNGERDNYEIIMI